MFSSNWRPFVLIGGESCLLVGAVAAAPTCVSALTPGG
jgi:hypothetical protein